jgi:hypothetical protein
LSRPPSLLLFTMHAYYIICNRSIVHKEVEIHVVVEGDWCVHPGSHSTFSSVKKQDYVTFKVNYCLFVRDH